MGKPGTGNAVSSRAEYIGARKASGGTETSQYPEERKSTETPRVVASERGLSPNLIRGSVHALRMWGCRAFCPVRAWAGGGYKTMEESKRVEPRTTEGNRPVDETPWTSD